MAAVYPTYKLRVDWDGTGNFAQTGAEVMGRVQALQYWSGRDLPSSELGEAVAGGLTVFLNNNSADYSSYNTESPLAGNVGPDKAVRLTMSGRAAWFVPGNSEYFTAGDILDLTTTDFSIGFWVYQDVVGQYGVVNKRDRASATNLGYAVETQSDGTIDLLLSDGTSVTTVSSTTTMSASTWYFCVVTADRDGNGQWYINAGSAEGATDITSQASTITNAIAFQVGAGFSTSANRFFSGRIQSIGIWTKLLSSTERTFMYKHGDGVQHKDIGLTGNGSTLTTNLLEWFDLQEESGNRTGQESSSTLTDTNSVLDAEGIPNFTVWQGFSSNVTPMPSQSGHNVARLDCIGPLGQVNKNKIRLATVTDERTGAAHDRILTEAGWPTADRTTDTGKTTMSRFGLENEVLVLGALRRVSRTEAGYTGESKDGRIVLEDRRHRQSGTHLVSQATFSDASGAALVYTGIRQLDSKNQVFHIFSPPVQTYTVGSLAVLWTLSSSGASSPLLQPGESITFWAEHPVSDSASNVDGVNAWTDINSGGTDMTANSASGGGGDNLTASVGITETKFYGSMKIVLINNHATTPAYITLLQARGTPVTKDDASRITVETAASYPRTYPRPPQHIPTIAEALSWAQWHSGILSKVNPALEMQFLATRDAAHMAHAMTLGLSDRITVTANNDTGLGLNEEFFIEFEKHKVDILARTHTTTWRLSAVADRDAWTLGISKLGIETRLAHA